MLPALGVPMVPYTPAWLAVLLPPIHVQRPVLGLNLQRSFSVPPFPLVSKPIPPKSQRLPLLSVQVAGETRLPGMFPADGVPNVP